MWTVLFTKNAEKDKPKLKATGLEKKTRVLLTLENPFQTPPSYEKLVGDLNGYYFCRINIQHRLVYRVDSQKHIVIVHSMWSH